MIRVLERSRMSIRRRTIVRFSIIAAVVLTVGLLVSVLVDPDRYRPQVVSFLEARTGKQIEIGHIGVRWLSGSVQFRDFGVRNPAPFPAGYVLKAPLVEAAVAIAPLLRHQVVIKSIVLHDP